jgi:hypothetical protein
MAADGGWRAPEITFWQQPRLLRDKDKDKEGATPPLQLAMQKDGWNVTKTRGAVSTKSDNNFHLHISRFAFLNL